MNKNNFIKLVALSVILLIMLVSVIYLNKGDNVPVVAEHENKMLVTENAISSYVNSDVKENIEKVEAGNLPENSREKSGERVDKIEHVEKSKFKQRCLDVLNNVTENIDVDNILPRDQAKIATIFNNCVYEIEAELALTEKQFIRSAETMACFDSIYKIRDYLLDLGTNAQLFSELPSNKESERAAITEAFINISNDIITNGGSAMMNRSILCSLDR